MKIGFFTDCHYCNGGLGGGRDSKASFDKTKQAMEEFKKQGVDICFCLGDLTDNGPDDTKETVMENFIKLTELIRSYNIPYYLVPGNHDYLIIKAEELKEKIGFKIPPYTVKTDKCNFIVLDANYRLNMERFDIAGVEWTDSNLPPEQVKFLKEELKSSDKDCIVLVHENLDPYVHYMHIIKNSEEVRNIIKESGKVRMVIQGHFHNGAERIIDSTPYLTLPAMCEHKENYFKIIEI
jgi:alkaline phosphatase